MRAAWVLFGHSLRRSRSLILGMGLLFAAFQALASLMASTFQESQLFSRIAALVPEYVQQALGSSFFTMLSFNGIVTIGYVHFAVVGSLVGLAIAIGTEPAAETERGFSDLLLSRPVARASAMTRSVALLLAAATITNAMLLAGTWTGLALFARGEAQWPSPRTLLSLAGALWMLMVCWGSVGLAFGAAAKRRGAAGAAAGFLAIGMFLLDIVAGVWKPARGLGRLSPFNYFNPVEIAAGRPISLSDVAVLGGIAACSIAVAYGVYARRDL